MLKRRVLLRIIVSFLITFLPTVAFLFFIFQRISQHSLIKERDFLYNNLNSLLEHKLKDLELASTLPKSSENRYYIAFKINGNCTGRPYYWLTTDSIYYREKYFNRQRMLVLGSKFCGIVGGNKEI